METRISNTDAHNAFYLITFLSLLKHTYFFFFNERHPSKVHVKRTPKNFPVQISGSRPHLIGLGGLSIYKVLYFIDNLLVFL